MKGRISVHGKELVDMTQIKKTIINRVGAGLTVAAFMASLLVPDVANAPPAGAATSGFHSTGMLSTARERATATLLKDGRVLVVGGQDASGAPLSSSETYNPATGYWTATASLPLPVGQATATLLANGTVLVAGGLTGNPGSLVATGASQVFDPATSQWSSTKGPLAVPSFGARAVLLSSGAVLYAGGLTSTNGRDSATSVTELYDPTTGTWSTTGALPLGVADAEMIALADGRVLLAGGETAPAGRISAVAEVYQPSTRTWTPIAKMPSAVASATVTSLADNDVLVAGGKTGTFGSATNRAQIFHPTTGAWSTVEGLPRATFGASATLLPSGQVLYAGGMTNNASRPIGNVALFDPFTNRWVGPDHLLVPRGFQTAVRLADGSVLIAGGRVTSGVTATSELFPAGSGPAITSASTMAVITGRYSTFAVTTSGSPTPSLSVSGSLPPGMVFVANGNGTATIAGTPPAGAAGTFPVTITASNGVASPAVQTLVITLSSAPAITSASALAVSPGRYNAFMVTTSGSPTPTLSESGSLPPGMVFVANGNGTATIGGTPPANAIGTYVVMVTAGNGVGSPAVQTLVITLSVAPAITSPTGWAITAGRYSGLTVTTSGSPTPTLGESGRCRRVWYLPATATAPPLSRAPRRQAPVGPMR